MSKKLTLCLALICPIYASDPDLSGEWKLDESRSQHTALPVRAPSSLRLEHKGTAVRCEAIVAGQPGEPCSFSIGNTETRNRGREWTVSTKAKWEGSAILVNAIATSNHRRDAQHTFMDRWKLSRDGSTLTIRRVCVTPYGETESTLIYDRQPAV